MADLPVDGRPVMVDAQVRRLACRNWRCPRRTFREQIPGVLKHYQRHTTRLAAQVGALQSHGRLRFTIAADRRVPGIGVIADIKHTVAPPPGGAVTVTLGREGFACPFGCIMRWFGGRDGQADQHGPELMAAGRARSGFLEPRPQACPTVGAGVPRLVLPAGRESLQGCGRRQCTGIGDGREVRRRRLCRGWPCCRRRLGRNSERRVGVGGRPGRTCDGDGRQSDAHQGEDVQRDAKALVPTLLEVLGKLADARAPRGGPETRWWCRRPVQRWRR
ncbi:hypothetical protein [Actinomadura formosensis]|uniref:hypothetical protein n=1 Tax=Actinomadura formosensis TaxID=60706 RepID=UPI003899186D